ncbi:helix-turn-helix domain-containing protein [Kitasatospora sp. NPDC101183]|uniref:helix-turn-helix domain-containing protein n=1 Tax=Kitasatospora sp. NPDC101183 TaxID=3364100 RepID=UPI003820BBBD
MALRPNPSLRQLRLGAELRRMREQAGLGGSQLARALGINPAHVTQMESGRTGISVERLRTIAALCMCVNEPLIEALAEIITSRESGGWWEDYRGALADDFREIAEFEEHARAISMYSATFIPGLLQTRSYSSSIFSMAYLPLPQHELELRAEFRLRRQEIIRVRKTPFAAFIHEAALRMRFSGRRVCSEQLESLIDDSDLPNISIRVIPFDVDSLPSPIATFAYAEGSIPDLDTVQTDTGFGSKLIDAPAHVARFRLILAQMDSFALSESESREFIRSVNEEVKSEPA